MATSSIFANVRITDKKSAEQFIEAWSAASENPHREPTSDVAPPLKDKEAIRALFANRLNSNE